MVGPFQLYLPFDASAIRSSLLARLLAAGELHMEQADRRLIIGLGRLLVSRRVRPRFLQSQSRAISKRWGRTDAFHSCPDRGVTLRPRQEVVEQWCCK